MDRIMLAHGGGGKAMEDLIKNIFLKSMGNEILNGMEDAAALNIEDVVPSLPDSGDCRLAFTTDSFIVKPAFFPGGDIGRLSVCGTVNDLLCRGALPLYMSASFIIEEGFEIKKLEKIAGSMAKTSREAGIKLVAGDTKVAEKGSVDGIFINTSGIGVIPPDINISIKNARPGDAVIISGTIGNHGMAVLSAREGLEFESPLKSDVAPLVEMVQNIISIKGAVKVLRDPTRGGVAEVLNEIASRSGVGIEVWEEKLPVDPAVLSACDMLGFDFLHLANEGKIIAVVAHEKAKDVLEAIKKSRYGEKAEIIGRVNNSGLVTLKTRFGTFRIIDRPFGELLPRIC
ncbi:MAG TPA: hydrogenase expression/formation protein HypE [Thermoanaerobacterales bacterium]|nr:hydrogenase expression/formation protein HypE [Thermoanaerobacterales bacterium]